MALIRVELPLLHSCDSYDSWSFSRELHTLSGVRLDQNCDEQDATVARVLSGNYRSNEPPATFMEIPVR
jgi:hypothetical protein